MKPDSDSEIVQGDGTIAALIWRHYDKVGLTKGWRRDRFNRLCKLMNCVPEEVGALCLLKPHQIRIMMKNDKFPPTVALHLAIIEAVIIEMQCGKKWGPLLPLHLISKEVSKNHGD